jgi:hypothetical protein
VASRRRPADKPFRNREHNTASGVASGRHPASCRTRSANSSTVSRDDWLALSNSARLIAIYDVLNKRALSVPHNSCSSAVGYLAATSSYTVAALSSKAAPTVARAIVHDSGYWRRILSHAILPAGNIGPRTFPTATFWSVWRYSLMRSDKGNCSVVGSW